MTNPTQKLQRRRSPTRLTSMPGSHSCNVPACSLVASR
ncbi:hypothetical protein IF2G_01352 [Cordyceps javanica]|nr:hypothetical protein IF2G_01352 [Cordyceps javanica]